MRIPPVLALLPLLAAPPADAVSAAAPPADCRYNLVIEGAEAKALAAHSE
jgi:hypothetical protein